MHNAVRKLHRVKCSEISGIQPAPAAAAVSPPRLLCAGMKRACAADLPQKSGLKTPRTVGNVNGLGISVEIHSEATTHAPCPPLTAAIPATVPAPPLPPLQGDFSDLPLGDDPLEGLDIDFLLQTFDLSTQQSVVAPHSTAPRGNGLLPARACAAAAVAMAPTHFPSRPTPSSDFNCAVSPVVEVSTQAGLIPAGYAAYGLPLAGMAPFGLTAAEFPMPPAPRPSLPMSMPQQVPNWTNHSLNLSGSTNSGLPLDMSPQNMPRAYQVR